MASYGIFSNTVINYTTIMWMGWNLFYFFWNLQLNSWDIISVLHGLLLCCIKFKIKCSGIYTYIVGTHVLWRFLVISIQLVYVIFHALFSSFPSWYFVELNDIAQVWIAPLFFGGSPLWLGSGSCIIAARLWLIPLNLICDIGRLLWLSISSYILPVL